MIISRIKDGPNEVKKRRRRDPPFLLLHLLPGIKKTEKSSTRPPSLIIALSRDAQRAALFSFPTTIFTNSKYSYWCKIPEPDRAFAFRVFDPERERKERERERERRLRVENREKTSVLEKRQPSIGFFSSSLSLRRTSTSEREREKKRRRDRFLSFPKTRIRIRRESFSFLRSLRDVRIAAERIAGDDGGDMALSLSLSLTPRPKAL